MKKRIGKIAFLLTVGTAFSATAHNAPVSFSEWYEEFRREAVDKGISAQTLDIAFAEAQILHDVISRDRKQPELRQTFQAYLDNAINAVRVKKAKEMRVLHADLLENIEKRYGVPAPYLISFWALETNFGTRKGGYRLIDSLSTLAYDTRRPAFFRQELLHAVRMVQDGISPEKMVGSWAGAFGNFQFMPSTYHFFAVDYDKDGIADLWNSLPDAMASASNYLAAEGWDPKIGWGREVVLPKKFDWDLIEKEKTVAEWLEQGVRFVDSRPAEPAETKAVLFMPAGIGGPAFLTYSNFRVILKWNNSVLYAIAVGHLADRIGGGQPFSRKLAGRQNDFTMENALEMQELLKRLNLYDGEPDGVLGRKSREGIRAFQKMYDLPADGYADASLLHFMRLAVNGGAEREELTFDEISEIQKILKKGLYYKGPEDGKLGKATENGIKLYRQVYGICGEKTDRGLLEKMRLQSVRNLENGEVDPVVREYWRQEDEKQRQEEQKKLLLKKKNKRKNKMLKGKTKAPARSARLNAAKKNKNG